MTEHHGTYTVAQAESLAQMTERDVQRLVVKKMREWDWLVIVTSQDRQTRKQLKNVTDLICIRWGEVVFMEVKRPGGELRPGQIEFREALQPHLGTCVHHQVVHWPEDVDRWE